MTWLESLLSVIKNNRSDTKFPISASTEAFERQGVKMIRKLSLADQSKIADIQPCQEKRPILFALHRLDISRKHGPVVVQSNFLAGFTMAPRIDRDMFVEYLRRIEPPPNLDEQWRTVATIRTKFRLRLNPHYSLILENQAIVAGQEVTTTLRQFVDEVESVVDLFTQT